MLEVREGELWKSQVNGMTERTGVGGLRLVERPKSGDFTTNASQALWAVAWQEEKEQHEVQGGLDEHQEGCDTVDRKCRLQAFALWSKISVDDPVKFYLDAINI